ncbi:hypothetical protein PPSIR1_07723 [Plesiocystis pacifica SIR-1]|uniref:ABC transporter permease n=1 Tax=Plesiocystis pacifica SIR-1 TaxID=391625 RepID=A6GD66_9BACT|nr:hypothetical protein PPSIR1_07723 [Plesiocystis pacifica SIR-1]
MAWRNLWRNGRRTAITLFSIAFGVLLAVVSTGIGDSSYTEMIDYAARLGGGHVVVQHPDYVDQPSLENSIRVSPEALEAELDTLDKGRARVVGVAPRITGGIMLATSSNNVGAGVVAIDPRAESETTLGLVEALSEGEMFAGPDDKGIILGAVLAENLDVELGKKVVYTVTDKNGEIANGLARVSGIIETGAPEIDGATCLMPIGAMREVLGYEDDELTQLAVFIDDHHHADALATQLDAALGESVSALPWSGALPDLAAFVSVKEGGNVVMQAIITVLIAAGIFNTMFVSVMERMREFGILAAIGFSRVQLFALIVWESLWVALCGLIAGVVLTAYPYYYLATTGIDTAELAGQGAQVSGVTMPAVMYVGLYPPHAVVIAGAIVFATLAAGLYPAYRAGRVSPVEVIRIV